MYLFKIYIYVCVVFCFIKCVFLFKMYIYTYMRTRNIESTADIGGDHHGTE